MKNALKRFGIFLGVVEDKTPKFKEDAIDRDSDGIVQEGTVHERPAEPKKRKPSTKKKTDK